LRAALCFALLQRYEIRRDVNSCDSIVPTNNFAHTFAKKAWTTPQGDALIIWGQDARTGAAQLSAMQ
jgi:hypothetical protein